MYRYGAGNDITYTPEDLILFKESPFACWMERLTLENPDHGISPDLDEEALRNCIKPQLEAGCRRDAQRRLAESVEWGDFVTARESRPVIKTRKQSQISGLFNVEDKGVALIQWHAGESQRRAATLEAMQSGADFIVNGQLALGPFSGSVNLLIRSGGVSELGDYFYVPCDTYQETRLHCAFHLCFAADLLHSLQGTLPPQMLVIRPGAEMVSLRTEDHTHHFRAVKHRFLAAQLSFRKHRMPDPVDSSHFGRWSNCAHDVLKQRMMSQECQASAAKGSGSMEYHPALASRRGPWVHDTGETLEKQARPAITANSDDDGAGKLPANGWKRQAERKTSPAGGAPAPTMRDSQIDFDTPDPSAARAYTAAPEPTLQTNLGWGHQ